MLYIWPYIAFFCWPVLLPNLLPIILALLSHFTAISLPLPVRPAYKHLDRLPRWTLLVPCVGGALLIIHFNTIIHPFTLADNRHYTFYVFRILRLYPWIRYLAAPLYMLLAWACIAALGVPPAPENALSGGRHTVGERGRRVSTVVLWLAVCTLCLATAPLVEPRYFILPWITWRLNVPLPSPALTLGEMLTLKSLPAAAARAPPRRLTSFTDGLAGINVRWAVLSLEMAWMFFVNVAVGYMFLYRGFRWHGIQGEEQNIQRFMW